jgi:hypothetical protein
VRGHKKANHFLSSRDDQHTKRHTRTAGRAYEKTNKPDKAKLFPKTFRKLEKKKGHRNPFYVMRE